MTRRRKHQHNINCAVKFAGENHPLSNFRPSRINWGCVSETIESAYQYKQAVFEGDRQGAMKIKETCIADKPKEPEKPSNEQGRCQNGKHSSEM